MSKKTKILLGICISQAVCLAFGLWIRGRFQLAVETVQATSIAITSDQSASTQLKNDVQAQTGKLSATNQLVVELVSFIWIMGLQTAGCWLLIQRLFENDGNEAAREENSLLAAKELIRTRDAIIFGLAKLAESRDPETGQHLERISLYSVKLASTLKQHPLYRKEVTSSFVRMIGISSVLHDIGKVGVEDAVLLKPGNLTDDERKHIQEHTQLGGDCIHEIERRLGNSEFLSMAKDIAHSHHERWDGTGYPRGLRGYQIPLAARIVAIADVYDALSSKRVYKDSYPHDVCLAKIKEGSGTQFDAELVQVFLQISDQFEEIAKRFSDAKSSQRMSVTQEFLLESIMTPDSDELIEQIETVSSGSAIAGRSSR